MLLRVLSSHRGYCQDTGQGTGFCLQRFQVLCLAMRCSPELCREKGVPGAFVRSLRSSSAQGEQNWLTTRRVSVSKPQPRNPTRSRRVPGAGLGAPGAGDCCPWSWVSSRATGLGPGGLGRLCIPPSIPSCATPCQLFTPSFAGVCGEGTECSSRSYRRLPLLLVDLMPTLSCPPTARGWVWMSC